MIGGWSWFAIAVGGGAGAVARFMVARQMGHWLGTYLPYGTLTVNALGSWMLEPGRWSLVVNSSMQTSGVQLVRFRPATHRNTGAAAGKHTKKPRCLAQARPARTTELVFV